MATAALPIAAATVEDRQLKATLIRYMWLWYFLATCYIVLLQGNLFIRLIADLKVIIDGKSESDVAIESYRTATVRLRTQQRTTLR